MHQAKGLEWKAVFIIWAAEGKFPSPRSLKELDSEEEERRLWYVALTRAQDELYVTYPLLITDYNRQTVLQKPSRFVTECPPALFEVVQPLGQHVGADSGQVAFQLGKTARPKH